MKALKNENADLKAKVTTNGSSPIQSGLKNATPQQDEIQQIEVQQIEIQQTEIKTEPSDTVESQPPIVDENFVSNDDATFYDASDVTIIEQTPITVTIDDDSGDSGDNNEPAEYDPNATTTFGPECLTPISEEEETDVFRDTIATPNGVISPPKQFGDERSAEAAVTEQTMDDEFLEQETWADDSGLAPDSKNSSEVSVGREVRVLHFIEELASKQKLFRADTQYDMDNAASKLKCNKKESSAEMTKQDSQASPIVIEVNTTLDIKSEAKISEGVNIAIHSEVVDTSTDKSVDLEFVDDKPITSEQLRVPPTPAKRIYQPDFRPSTNSTPFKETIKKPDSVKNTPTDPEMDFLLSKASESSNTVEIETSVDNLEAQVD